MSPCVFCRIVDREAPATVLAETVNSITIEPLNPYVPGHALVIPLLHVTDATEHPLHAGEVLADAARFLGARQGNLMTSVGPDATQTVMHLHVHVLPRGAADGLAADWPWNRPEKEADQ